MTTHHTWVIIPAFNENVYLDHVLAKLSQLWPQFVVIDDGSTDQTSKIAQKYTPHVLRHAVNLGKGAALRSGSEYAIEKLKAKSLIFFDADDQHDPRYIAPMVELLQYHPVVLGVRSFGNEMPLLRIMLNRVASVLILFFFGRYIPDIPSGFKGMTTKTYRQLKLQSSHYEIEMEIAARVAQHKIPFVEIAIPTIYHDYDRGMTLLNILHMFEKIISWRFSK